MDLNMALKIVTSLTVYTKVRIEYESKQSDSIILVLSKIQHGIVNALNDMKSNHELIMTFLGGLRPNTFLNKLNNKY